MSTTPPPDRPTEPLRPARRAPVVQERVVEPAIDPNIVLLRLEDEVRSLRSGLMIVGVIAVAALALALWALLSDDTATTRGGQASDASVAQLDDRVDRLSRQVQNLRAGGVTALDERVDSLERTVNRLASRPAPEDPTEEIQQLTERVDELSRDVDELKQSQAAP